MADRKKRSSGASSRKTVRQASAGYTLEADDTEPADPERRKTHKEEVVGHGGDDEGAKAAEPEPVKAAEPEPEPEPVKAAEPEPEPEPVKAAEPEPEPEPVKAAEPEPEPVKAAAPEPEPERERERAGGYAVLLPPEQIVVGDPEADAPAPGPAPPGDSRSFRRVSGGIEEFYLIYRSGNHLVSRSGVTGKNGTWKVVEYPSIGSAAHAYAQECSELTGRGFRDVPRPAEA